MTTHRHLVFLHSLPQQDEDLVSALQHHFPHHDFDTLNHDIYTLVQWMGKHQLLQSVLYMHQHHPHLVMDRSLAQGLALCPSDRWMSRNAFFQDLHQHNILHLDRHKPMRAWAGLAVDHREPLILQTLLQQPHAVMMLKPNFKYFMKRCIHQSSFEVLRVLMKGRENMMVQMLVKYSNTQELDDAFELLEANWKKVLVEKCVEQKKATALMQAWEEKRILLEEVGEGKPRRQPKM